MLEKMLTYRVCPEAVKVTILLLNLPFIGQQPFWICYLLTYLLTYLFAYLLTYLLTHSMVHNIIRKADCHSACQKNILLSYETRTFITVFTKARHCILP